MTAEATVEVGGERLRADEPLLQADDIVQYFTVSAPGVGRQIVQAVSGVSFEIYPGETLALVGESGCGKSTLARCVLQSPKPKGGSIRFRGTDLTKLGERELSKAIIGMQVVFQDPYSSLDPHWRVLDSVAEPLRINKVGSKAEQRERAGDLLDSVGLDPNTYGRRRPRELSGGQCQRVAIARALALSPLLLVCDEPASSLDVSVQAQILNLFEDLQRRLGLAYLFITHDLSVAKHVSDRVAVMYLGKIVEIGAVADIFRQPIHPYSAALLSAIPEPDNPGGAGRIPLQGDLPSAAAPPSGCRFRTRCPFADQICSEQEPPLVEYENGRKAACHFPLTKFVSAADWNEAVKATIPTTDGTGVASA